MRSARPTRRGVLAALAGLPALLAGRHAASAAPLAARDVRLLETDVAGTVHAGTRARLPQLAVGQALLLRREPENPYDVRAILVLDRGGTKLGYVPRRHNRVPAAMMDAGLPLHARISALTPQRYECLRLEVTVTVRDAGG